MVSLHFPRFLTLPNRQTQRQLENMPIEMPRGLPFSVDTWTPSSKRKRHHFLTHAHKDHCSGILTHSSYPIYCTHLTKSLVMINYPQVTILYSRNTHEWDFVILNIMIIIIFNFCFPCVDWGFIICGYWGGPVGGDWWPRWAFLGYSFWCESLPW